MTGWRHYGGDEVAPLRRSRTGANTAVTHKSLEMKPDTLRKWVDRARVDRGVKDGLSSDAAAELKALKRENKKLKQQVDILEKATVFFVSRGLDAHK